jgi:hypothetical protein
LTASSSLIPTSRSAAACPDMATVKDPHLGSRGESMAKFNYQQARKQKEVARKARQQEKQQRRSTRPGAAGEQTEEVAAEKVGDPREPNPEIGT